MSSSWAKPCVHHTVAVFPAALAIKGRASAPAPAIPIDARRTLRLVGCAMALLPFRRASRRAVMDGENMGSRRPSRDHPWVTLNGHTSPTQATGQTPAPAVAAVEHRVSVAGADRGT